MPRHSPRTMTKAKVLRTLVGEPITDKALKEIYDRLDDLQPDLEAKQSPIRKRESPVGSTMLARNYKGEFLLAVKTPMGYQVDLNANLVPLSKGNKPSKGLRSNRNKPIKNEALLYDKLGNLSTYSKLTIGSLSEISSDTDKILMSDNGEVKYVTGVNLLTYIGGQETLTFGIDDTNAVKIDSNSVADDEYARFTANGLESRSASEVRSDIGAGTSSVSALNDLSDVTYSSGDLTISSLDQIIADDFVVDSGASITLDSHSGNFIAKKAGTEFSAANSAYAGMMLGYTKIMNDSTTVGHATITINSSSMTVMQTAQGTDLSIQFKVPPSGNVEIECSFWMTGVSKGAKFSLSTGTSYAELDEKHTYDADQVVYIDETDHSISTIKFTVTGLTAGTDTTYYLAGLASGSSTYISHGRNRTTGSHYPPIILKATALPATIVTGE